MSSKHTPGPWNVDEYTSGNSMFGFSPACAVMCRDNNKVICEIPDYTMGQFDKEDARLIAAAPDLLKACRRVMERYVHVLGGLSDDALDEVQAAIAKATGGAQ